MDLLSGNPLQILGFLVLAPVLFLVGLKSHLIFDGNGGNLRELLDELLGCLSDPFVQSSSSKRLH